jgi:hypothetical protein
MNIIAHVIVLWLSSQFFALYACTFSCHVGCVYGNLCMCDLYEWRCIVTRRTMYVRPNVFGGLFCVQQDLPFSLRKEDTWMRDDTRGGECVVLSYLSICCIVCGCARWQITWFPARWELRLVQVWVSSTIWVRMSESRGVHALMESEEAAGRG